jgi:MOSC domain-containing protein YiiM
VGVGNGLDSVGGAGGESGRIWGWGFGRIGGMSAHPQGTVAAVSRNEMYSFTKPNRDEIVLLTGLGVEGDVHAGVTVKHRGRVAADPRQPNLRQVHLIHAELFEEVGEEGFEVAPGQLGENVTTSGLDLLGLPRGTVLRFGPPPPPVANGGSVDGADGPKAPSAGVAAAGGAEEAVTPAAGDTAAGEASGGAEVAAGVAAIVDAAAQADLDAPTADAVAKLVEVARALGRDDGNAERSGVDRRATVVITGLRNPCGQINGFRPGLLKQVLGRDDAGNLIRKAGIMGVVLRGGPVRTGDPISVELPARPYLPLERV